MNTISGASAAPSSVQFGRRDHSASPSAHSPVRAAAHQTRRNEHGVDDAVRNLWEDTYIQMPSGSSQPAASLDEIWRAINSSDNNEATVSGANAESDGNHESDGSSSDEAGTGHHLMAARRFSPQDDLQSRLERLVQRSKIPNGKIWLNDTKTGVVSAAYEKF